jgi:hypothetical protein
MKEDMKVIINIPNELYDQARAKAAREGISIDELITRSLQSALEKSPRTSVGHRIPFPLIRGSSEETALTSETVAEALRELDEEQAQISAELLRR